MRPTLNPRRRNLAVTLFLACFMVVIVVIIGGIAFYIILKMCKWLPKEDPKGTNTNEVASIVMPKDWYLQPRLDRPTTLDVTSEPFTILLQHSVDLTNWETRYYLTGLLSGASVPLTLLDTQSNVVRQETVPMLPFIAPSQPIVESGSNVGFYRLVPQ